MVNPETYHAHSCECSGLVPEIKEEWLENKKRLWKITMMGIACLVIPYLAGCLVLLVWGSAEQLEHFASFPVRIITQNIASVFIDMFAH
jgi:hypothetical protein